MKRPKRKISEHDVQGQILGYLKHRVKFVRRQNVGAAKLKGYWVRFAKKGDPDIYCIYRGHFIGIEVKKPGEKQSADQIKAMEEIRAAGGTYILAESVDDVVLWFALIA
jgi:penicillin-binding protein-related factor A (putative recombinase)